jgi:hypothetical protein
VAVSCLRQLCEQLGDHIEHQGATDPTMYDDRHDDEHSASATAAQAVRELREIADTCGRLGAALGAVSGHLNHLGHENR